MSDGGLHDLDDVAREFMTAEEFLEYLAMPDAHRAPRGYITDDDIAEAAGFMHPEAVEE